MPRFLFFNSLVGFIGSIGAMVVAIIDHNHFAYWGWFSAVFLWVPVVLQRWRQMNG